MNYPAKMPIFSTIYTLLFHPVETARKLLINKPVNIVLVIILVSVISVLWAQWIQHIGIHTSYPTGFLSLIPLKIIVYSFILFLIAAAWHLSADMLGAAGRGLNLLYFICIALLPLWFMGISAFIFIQLIKVFWVYTLIRVVLWIWVCLLLIQYIKELYRFTALKAWITFLIPPVTVSLTGLIIILLTRHDSRHIDMIINTLKNYMIR